MKATSLERRAKNTPRVQIRRGRVFWEPSKTLRAAGYKTQKLGLLCPEILNQADELNAAADDHLAGVDRPAAGSVRALFDRYESSPAFAELMPRTQADRKRHLRHAAAGLGAGIRADQITTAAVKAWHDAAAARSPGDAANMLRSVSAAFAWAGGTNPAAGIRTAKRRRRARVATREELAAMVAAADRLGLPHVGAAAILAVSTMQRIGDVLAIEAEQIGEDNRLFLTQSKTGVELALPLHPRAVAELERLPATGRLFPVTLDTFQDHWAKARALAAEAVPSVAGRAAGPLDPEHRGALEARDMRRTGMVWLAERGVQVTAITAMSGHAIESGSEILEHYLPRTAQMRRAAIQMLSI